MFQNGEKRGNLVTYLLGIIMHLLPPFYMSQISRTTFRMGTAQFCAVHFVLRHSMKMPPSIHVLCRADSYKYNCQLFQLFLIQENSRTVFIKVDVFIIDTFSDWQRKKKKYRENLKVLYISISHFVIVFQSRGVSRLDHR